MSSRLKGLAVAIIVLGWAVFSAPSGAVMAFSRAARSGIDGGASPTASPTPLRDCQPAWQLVDTPNSAGDPYYLGGVAALSPADVWAVGGFFTGTLTEHWDGSSWQFVDAPSPEGENSGVSNVVALSSNNLWAVGSNFDSHTTLIEHWNGQSWSVVPSPNPNSSDELHNILAIAPDDIWVVGDSVVASGGIGVLQTLTEHWDGTSWRVIPSANINPPGGLLANDLYAVAASSANDVWAVGNYDDSSGSIPSLVEHWDGVSWQVVPVPHPSQYEHLYAATAISAADVWAVGSFDTVSSTTTLLALHWDGVSWQTVDVPYPDPRSNGLRGITALSSKDIWAVTDHFHHGLLNQTLVEHWDGKRWQVVSSPSYPNHYNTLNAIAAVSSSELWAVGQLLPEDPGTLAMHYTTPPGCPTVTPTDTPTASATPTNTPQPSVTDTPTASASATATNPPTASVTPMPQSSATVMPSPAASATPCGQSYADVTPEYWAYGYIHYLSCRAIVSGYPDGLFRPDNPISRAEFSKMLALGYGLPLLTAAQPSFADVPASYWAYTYIESLHAAGAISGYPDGSFHPNASISRAEMVKMEVAASGVSAYTGALADYPDVPPSYWAYGYIKTATYKQWVGGYPDGLFHPASNASRAELSKVLYLSLSYPRR